MVFHFCRGGGACGKEAGVVAVGQREPERVAVRVPSAGLGHFSPRIVSFTFPEQIGKVGSELTHGLQWSTQLESIPRCSDQAVLTPTAAASRMQDDQR
eukprot:m.191549 g.191549  ORF g.191549 m.191549 type:complete len:98 (+) comp15148_c0_seq9:75-368(+)